MNFYACDAFLTSMAQVCAPGRPYRIGLYRTAGQVFRLLSVDGGPPVTRWPFYDSVAPLEGTPDGPVHELRYLPVVRLETTEVTEVPATVEARLEHYPAPFIDWTRFSSWDAFTDHFVRRRSTLRRDSRQKRRHLERDHGPLSFVVQDARREVFERCIAWKSAQYLRTGLSDTFADARNVELFRLLFAKDVLLISSLSAGERLLAVHFGGLADDGVYSWVAAYDPEFGRYSPGRLLLEDLLRACQARGHREFDFGIGHCAYKWYYATHNRTLGPLGRPTLLHVVRREAKVTAKRVLMRWPALYDRVQALRAKGRGCGAQTQE